MPVLPVVYMQWGHFQPGLRTDQTISIPSGFEFAIHGTLKSLLRSLPLQEVHVIMPLPERKPIRLEGN